jgi:HAD superfamily hydrolase (TIGR01458 family)
MHTIKAVLLDISGTIHIENECIPGAIQAVSALMNRSDLKVHFVSNTTKESRQSLLRDLNTLGFPIQSEHITTSLSASIEILQSFQIKKPYLLVSEDALQEFHQAGFHDSSTEDHLYDAVVVGLAPELFDYNHINQAFNILNRLSKFHSSLESNRLIAIHKGRYYATQKGLCLGPGPFVSALEYATGLSETIQVILSSGFK